MKSPALSVSSMLVGALLVAGHCPAYPDGRPRALARDSRIRWINYDEAAVISVDTTLGVATQIQLDNGEDYVTHAFGDSAAYDFQQIGRHLLLKPRADQADTNLVYITSKRNYSFLLRYAKFRQDGGVFRLLLRYPDQEKVRTQVRIDRDAVARGLAQPGFAIHWQGYTMSGDLAIGPEAAWDDGAQTWFRFAPGQYLPAVYFVTDGGDEVIANRHMEGDRTIVLHRTAARWHVRLGDQALAIFNDDAHATRSLSTGTVSPAIERVLRQEPE